MLVVTPSFYVVLSSERPQKPRSSPKFPQPMYVRIQTIVPQRFPMSLITCFSFALPRYAYSRYVAVPPRPTQRVGFRQFSVTM